VFTHVTQDHLDRHGSVEAYRATKRRLAELVDPDGRLVVNAEDPVSGAYAGLGTAPAVLYRRSRPIPGGVGVVDGWIVADAVERLPLAGRGQAVTGADGRIMPLGEIPLPGAHNVSNVLAAVGVGLMFGIAPDAIRAGVGAFQAVEHRLEPVATIDGVRFVNDSQGTQPDAVIAALESFTRPLVLIAGGRDKGVPLDALARAAVDRADAVVLIGESAPLLAGELATAGHRRVERAADLEHAVRDADAIARELRGSTSDTAHAERPIATVLLSPAATSFDMFVDYAARGRAFKEAVGRLATTQGGAR
jgi:UDP-N-acetylmuramoylalanine--D-glutamate ligase